MGRITIHTTRHRAAVQAVVQRCGQLLWAVEGGVYSCGAGWRGDELPGLLFSLLFDVCVGENPVFAQSPRLTQAAQGLRGQAVYAAEYKAFRAFLRESKTLNIEGYTQFRMADIRHRLDTLIFSLLRGAV